MKVGSDLLNFFFFFTNFSKLLRTVKLNGKAVYVTPFLFLFVFSHYRIYLPLLIIPAFDNLDSIE
jgi:hypothetical protein